MSEIEKLLKEIRACTLCRDLPEGPNPVLQAGEGARILVAGQAPGIRVHNTGLPFNDPSGERLRAWMGIGRETFYDPHKVNVIPMGFCYPGSVPKKGDLPPRPECRKTWHDKIFATLPDQRVRLIIGQYAQAYHLGPVRSKTLTETVRRWRDFAPNIFPLPHPSPRNTFWLQQNPWFEKELIPALKSRIKEVLKT